MWTFRGFKVILLQANRAIDDDPASRAGFFSWSEGGSMGVLSYFALLKLCRSCLLALLLYSGLFLPSVGVPSSHRSPPLQDFAVDSISGFLSRQQAL